MVKVIAKIVDDNSGVFIQIPVLIDENQQVLMPLLEYTLLLKRNGKSHATLLNYVNASKLLLEYMNANINCFATPMSLFQGFSSRLYMGTIGNDGLDPSGLYWLPHSKQVSRTYIIALTKITDWLSAKYGEMPVNPLVEADSLSKRLNYAAWFRKNQHNFLGHIKDKYINATVHYARSLQGKRALGKQSQDAIEFPEHYFEAFYFKGIGGAVDPRVALRDQLIILLMHGAGLRESEAFHLWIEDVLIDPLNPDSVKVRIYHPEDGKAPHNWRGRSGKTTRAAYLKEKYALNPRIDLIGKKHVGWKSRVTDSKDEYLDVHWFPIIFGEIFAKLWQAYTRFIAKVDRKHPYAFICFHRKYLGNPYTLNAFHNSYRQALGRIGLKPSKADGLSPHSHRHSYGRRLRRAEVPEIVIKKCLHHAALESQRVYTTPTLKEINSYLNAATARLLNPSELVEKRTSSSWEVLTDHNFNNFSFERLFTGMDLKLGQQNVK
ncbi:gamma-mobile-trio recombinase GmtY [Acinetobacter seifertii]|uniref:gamma-mobile-trio recombinase GmtY n=1 Tax=Acinetobacter seifertii TaxID=1530123 RepID=UPI00386273E9